MSTSRWFWIFVILVASVVRAAPAAPPSEAPTSKEPAYRVDEARRLWERGFLFHQLGLYEDAIQQFHLSIAIEPSAEAHTFLGWTLSHQGKLEMAIAECKTAIEIDPDFGNPYNDIGVYLIDLGRAGEAMAWFDRAIESKRYCCYQFAHFNKGRVLLEQGKLDEARRSFRRALLFDPDYGPALEMLRQLDEAQGKPL